MMNYQKNYFKYLLKIHLMIKKRNYIKKKKNLHPTLDKALVKAYICASNKMMFVLREGFPIH